MRAEMWAPLDLAPRAANRFGSSLRVFARLKPDVSLEQARADVDAINAHLVQAYPETNTGLKLRVDQLSDKVVGNVRRTLLVLVAAVGLVLLIACANVACLQLARLARRQKDAAVRVALGARRRHILTQLLTESLVLSFCGAIAGLVLAIWGVDWLTSILAGSSNEVSSKMPRVTEISVDRVALAFATAVSLATTVLFGLVPALVASKPDVNQTLKDTGRGTMGGRGRLREGLVVAELALALVLLIGAGLLVKSFVNLYRVDPGFNPQNLVAMTVSLAGARQYSGERSRSLLSPVDGEDLCDSRNHIRQCDQSSAAGRRYLGDTVDDRRTSIAASWKRVANNVSRLEARLLPHDGD